MRRRRAAPGTAEGGADAIADRETTSRRKRRGGAAREEGNRSGYRTLSTAIYPYLSISLLRHRLFFSPRVSGGRRRAASKKKVVRLGSTRLDSRRPPLWQPSTNETSRRPMTAKLSWSEYKMIVAEEGRKWGGGGGNRIGENSTTGRTDDEDAKAQLVSRRNPTYSAAFEAKRERARERRVQKLNERKSK